MKKGILLCLFMCGWLLQHTLAQDLIVSNSNFTATQTKHAGGQAVVRYEVKNIGTQTVSQNTTVRFYLSSNTTLDNNDYQFPVTDQVGTLSPQNSDDENADLTIPVSWSPGSYYILIQADANDEVAETNEGNNVKHTPITVTAARADLFVFSPTVPASLVTGQTFTARVSYGNQGSIDAGPARLAVYASANNTFEAGTDVLLGSVDMPGIGNQIADRIRPTIITDLGWPESISGNAYVLLVADDTDQVVELDETVNNVQARAINITLTNADLAFTATSVNASTVASGSSITASATIRNNGTTSSNATQVDYYLSSNTSLDAADDLLGSRNLGALAVGASGNLNATVTIPGGTFPGNYYIIYEVDGNNVAGEPSGARGNNTTFVAVTVVDPVPDLSFTDLRIIGSSTSNTGLPSEEEGGFITVNWTVRNTGTGLANSYQVEFWLSTNTSINVFDDTELSPGFGNVVQAGGTSNGNAQLSIPANFVSSTRNYYLIARIVGVAPFENNTGNNTRNRQFEIRNRPTGGVTPPGGGGGITPVGPGLLRMAPEGSSFTLSTYPNPAQGNTQISFGASGRYTLAVYNIQGALMHRATVQNAQAYALNVQSYPKGMYLVKAQSGTLSKTLKLMVK